MDISNFFGPYGKQILVIMGDGSLEKRVISELAPRFDGTGCRLVFTQLPPPYQVKKGLCALEALTFILHLGYRANEILFVVDKEHVDINLKGLIKRLEESGSMINEVKEIGENAWLIIGLHGSSPFSLYIAVAGKEKSMDEEVQEFGRALGLHASARKILMKIREVDKENLKRCLEG